MSFCVVQRVLITVQGVLTVWTTVTGAILDTFKHQQLCAAVRYFYSFAIFYCLRATFLT